jgi:hypothetical protein
MAINACAALLWRDRRRRPIVLDTATVTATYGISEKKSYSPINTMRIFSLLFPDKHSQQTASTATQACLS